MESQKFEDIIKDMVKNEAAKCRIHSKWTGGTEVVAEVRLISAKVDGKEHVLVGDED